MTPSSTPVVVVGMHRSGTTLVAKLLARCGVFMGADLNVHWESETFLDLNTRLFRLCHGEWDVPGPVRDVLGRSAVLEDIAAELERYGMPRLRRAYLGRGWLAGALSRGGWPSSWGWKDPRSSLTLSAWQRCFPGARVVNVYRNPADVALSLATRERCRYRVSLERPTRRSFTCLEKDAGVRLWAQYVRSCLHYREMWPNEAWLDLCYEDLLAQPMRTLEKLAAFAGRDVSKNGREAVEGIQGGRAYAFRGGPDADWGESLLGSLPEAVELGYAKQTGESSGETVSSERALGGRGVAS